MDRINYADRQGNGTFNWMPDNLKKNLGQFNVFRLNDNGGPGVNCMPYNRKGFYKISLLIGNTRLFYADKTLEIEKSGLLFSNPNIPYSWEHLAGEQTGYFCVFTEAFFDQFAHIKDYPVFKPGHIPLFELSNELVEKVASLYLIMLQEIESDFAYKYDALRTMVLELIYLGLKIEPATGRQYNESNASLRIASLFTELLERQFPIESPRQGMKFRTPAEFAAQLSVHVNHLNRALKDTTGKTTSRLIAERIVQEARGLLRHTDWNISEIAWSLGFEELPNFINFFKKNEHLTPNSFRKLQGAG